MKKVLKFLGISLLSLIVLLVIIPLLIPLPQLQNVVPARILAAPDSQFVTLNGVEIHYKVQGNGEPVLLLLHGFLANTFTWEQVLPDLAQAGTVIAFDRPAFGLSGRPLTWPDGQNPYTPEAQVEIAMKLLDTLNVGQVILVGNSAGGTVAAQIALTHPERVAGVVFVDAAIFAGGGAPQWIKPVLATPQGRRIGQLVVRNLIKNPGNLVDLAWHDPGKVPPAYLEGYRSTFQVENWDQALWEFTLASRETGLEGRIQEITLPVLVITGDDDRIVPTEQSILLAERLPQAELVVVPNCGHVPQEECPDAFLEAVFMFIYKLKGAIVE